MFSKFHDFPQTLRPVGTLSKIHLQHTWKIIVKQFISHVEFMLERRKTLMLTNHHGMQLGPIQPETRFQTRFILPFSSTVWTLAPRDSSSWTACFRPLRAARWRGLRRTDRRFIKELRNEWNVRSDIEITLNTYFCLWGFRYSRLQRCVCGINERSVRQLLQDQHHAVFLPLKGEDVGL